MRNESAKVEKAAEGFFGALQDVFVGAPVEGRSSFFVGSFIVPRYSSVRTSLGE